MLIEQPSCFLRMLYPQAIWRMDPSKREVYLTFDDGPIPRVTTWTLDLLDKYDIKATFFMVGDNVRKHPEEYQDVVRRGHAIGNHTFHHLRGFQVQVEEYSQDIALAGEYMSTKLFRPPHGFMTPKQYAYVKQHFRLIMWDLVTRDYSKRLTGKQVFRNVQRYVRNGSIITFHDSLKAESKLHYALPRSIEWLLEQGYTFHKFTEDACLQGNANDRPTIIL